MKPPRSLSAEAKLFSKMITELVLALSIGFLVWLAYQIEPGFIPPSGRLVSFLMGLATLLTGCLLYSIYLKLIVYDVVQVILAVVFFTALAWVGFHFIRQCYRTRQLQNTVNPPEKLSWVDFAKWTAIVLGIVGATIAVVLVGTFAMY